MPRRTRMPGADDALAACGKFCDALSEVEDRDEELREERRTAWLAASDLGATYEEIAETCFCSPALVKQELARARGASWAQ